MWHATGTMIVALAGPAGHRRATGCTDKFTLLGAVVIALRSAAAGNMVPEADLLEADLPETDAATPLQRVARQGD